MVRASVILPSLLLLLAIIVPFVMFGDWIETQLTDYFDAPQAVLAVVSVVIGLLALDVVLPLPSSLIAAAAGAFLGFAGGALAIFAGLMLGSGFGFALGRHVGEPILARTSGAEGLPQAGRGQVVALVATRAVPVLSEAMTVTAGATRMPRTVFWSASALANFGVAMTYAAVGAMAATANTFLWVFAASIVVPGVAWLGYRFIRG